MIKLELLVNENKVEEIKKLLRDIGIKRITLSVMKEYDEDNVHVEGYRGSTYTIDFTEKIKIEIVLNSMEAIDRTLHMLSVANIDANILVYEIMKSYHISKRVTQDNSFSFGDNYRNS